MCGDEVGRYRIRSVSGRLIECPKRMPGASEERKAIHVVDRPELVGEKERRAPPYFNQISRYPRKLGWRARGEGCKLSGWPPAFPRPRSFLGLPKRPVAEYELNQFFHDLV
jgi:hypothetical protein